MEPKDTIEDILRLFPESEISVKSNISVKLVRPGEPPHNQPPIIIGLDKYLTLSELEAFEESRIRRLLASAAVSIHPPRARWHEPGEFGFFEGEIELPEGLTPPSVQLVLSQSQIDKTEAWYAEGAVLEESGRLEAALCAYDKALMINLNYAAAWCRRGNVLTNLDRPKEAFRAFNKAIRIDPNFADAWNDKGVARERTGDYLGARLLYEQALSVDPNHALAADNRVKAIREQHRREQLDEDWRKKCIEWDQKFFMIQEILRKSSQAPK